MGIERIEGLNVEFPYEAYEVQRRVMASAVRAVRAGQNALLESPTGTGKTLALLCGLLAWQAEEGGAGIRGDEYVGSRIVYCTRTHAQLAQVERELMKSVYRVPCSTVGSRRQLCVHADVSTLSGSEQDARCQALVRSNGCPHYEELGCPYYEARRKAVGASLVLAPYNYLVDPRVRRSLGLSLKDAVVVFDEAHNLPGVCEEATSFRFSTSMLQNMARGVQETMKILDGFALGLLQFGEAVVAEALPHEKTLLTNLRNACVMGEALLGLDAEGPVAVASSPELEVLNRLCAQLPLLSRIFLHLESKVRSLRKAGGAASTSENSASPLLGGLRLPMSRLRAWMGELVDRSVEWAEMAAYLGLMMEQVVAFAGFYRNTLGPKIAERRMQRPLGKGAGGPGLQPRLDLVAYGQAVYPLSEFASLLQYVYVQDGPAAQLDQQFVLYVGEENGDAVLNVWCFTAAVCMERLQAEGVRCVLLASGTLAPFDGLEQELGLRFPVRLENPHVVLAQQVWAGVIPSDPDGVRLNSSYRSRSSEEYILALGNTLIQMARLIPAGVLVFFPSYRAMEDAMALWQVRRLPKSDQTVWEQLARIKVPVVEPRDPLALKAAIAEYQQKVASASGAVFFAVCRGKVAEGLDFADDMGRAVVVTGLPYPHAQDPRVVLKRLLLDERAKSDTSGNIRPLNGTEWYALSATRAVNQAVGRVIRHRNDYGAIVLCDERFGLDKSIESMSLWMREYIRCHPSFGDAAVSLAAFFSQSKFATKPSSIMERSERILPPTLVKPSVISLSSTATTSPKSAFNMVSSVSRLSTSAHDESEKLAGGRGDGVGVGGGVGGGRSVDPRPGSVAVAAMSPQKTAARQFLTLLKTALSQEQYTRFVGWLRDYALGSLQLPVFVESVDEMFSSMPAQVDVVALRKAFLLHLPQSSRGTWEKAWEAKLNPSPAVVESSPPLPPEEASTPTKRLKLDPVVAPPVQAEASFSLDPPPMQHRCVVCKGPLDSPFAARCGHVACYRCWLDWLQHCLECPVCRGRVRSSNLLKLYFV